jgi:hypothetical protein
MNVKLVFQLVGLILAIVVLCWAPVVFARWALFRSSGSRGKAVERENRRIEFPQAGMSFWIPVAFEVAGTYTAFRHLFYHLGTWWDLIASGILILVGLDDLLGLPATIFVDDHGIQQRYWLRPDKFIRWNEIVEINTGDKIRIVTIKSADGTTIVHSKYTADRPRFLRELKSHCLENLPPQFPEL